MEFLHYSFACFISLHVASFTYTIVYCMFLYSPFSFMLCFHLHVITLFFFYALLSLTYYYYYPFTLFYIVLVIFFYMLLSFPHHLLLHSFLISLFPFTLYSLFLIICLYTLLSFRQHLFLHLFFRFIFFYFSYLVSLRFHFISSFCIFFLLPSIFTSSASLVICFDFI